MSNKSQYMIKQINRLSFPDRETVCKILSFRGYELRQSNNGVYIHINKIDEDTFNDIYNFSKYKLCS